MRTWIYQVRRQLSYMMICALLCGVIGMGNGSSASAQNGIAAVQSVSASAQKTALRQATYLSDSEVSTQGGIVLEGREVQLQVSGLSYSVTDSTQTEGNIMDETGLVTTGSGLIATGTAAELQYGVSENVAIAATGAPVLFRFSNSKPLGICQQFRIITTASQGFDVWLLDASLTPIAAVQGLGGTKVWRTALQNYTTYYILVSGAVGTSGHFLCSDIIDDYGGTFGTSGNIYLNRDYSIETEISGDVDVLAFRASSAVSAYRIRIDSIAGSGGTYEVYDQKGRKLTKYSGTLKQSTVNMVFTPTAGAKYYFRFTSGQTGRKIVLKVAQAVTKYSLVYHLNGGKNASGNPAYYISTTSKFALKKPVRSRYLFGGWYLDSSYRTRVVYVQGSVRKSLHLYAKWVKVSPGATYVKSAKSSKTKQAVVKWKAVKGVKGYRIAYGTSRNLKKQVKKKNTRKTSLTLKGLKPGKTYYIKVCTYSRDSRGKKVYSKYSKVKKFKIKEKNVKKKTKKKAAKKSAVKKKSTVKKKNSGVNKTTK